MNKGRVCKNFSCIFWAVVILAHVASCRIVPERPSQKKDGGTYGVTKGPFLHRWWNYYERGVSYMEGGFWQYAEADFREAIDRFDTDRLRVRTYGRHLIDYFPHRELGITLFKQQRYTDAIRELEASLSSEKTARAEYYLDYARKKRIEEMNRDICLPLISVKSPGIGTLSNRQSIIVTGIVKDDTYVKSIRVNGDPFRIDLSAPEIAFKKEVPIRHGENRIVVEAADLTGKTSKAETTVLCDQAGPILNIDELSKDRTGNRHIIRGYAHDDSGIREIRVNGVNLLSLPVSELKLNHSVPLQPHQKEAVVVAMDRAGNQTRAVIRLSVKEDFSAYRNATDSLMLACAQPIPGLLANKTATVDSRGRMTDEKRLNRFREQGRYFALIIGIDRYENWRHLKTAANDAKALYKILAEKYGFPENNVRVRTDGDATRETIIRDMKRFAGGLGENDNLLVYFAGHGQLDETTGDGYWIPADGARDDPSTWITNSLIRNTLGSAKVRGKNILVIADSCFSGTLLRGYTQPIPTSAEDGFGGKPFAPELGRRVGEAKRNGAQPTVLEPESGQPGESDKPGRHFQKRIIELGSKRSRQVISSGGIEPVADKGEKRHSLFAWYLLKTLKESSEEAIDIEYLFNTRIYKPVADRGGQRPVIGRLNTPVDEYGQFVLVSKHGHQKAEKQSEDDSRRFTRTEVFPGREIGFPDTSPPVITLERPIDGEIVYMDQMLVELRITDESGIQSVSANGRKILKRPGRKLYLNYIADLDVGDNLLKIVCFDQVGNRAERNIRVHRKIGAIHDIGARMSVLFYPSGEKETPEAGTEATLMGKLLESGRFDLREPARNTRKHGSADSIRSPDLSGPVESAKKMKTEFVLISSVSTINQGTQISARVVETGTSHILTYQDVYGEHLGIPGIRELCGGLAVKLRDALPLVEGQVIGIRGADILIDLGEEHKIKQGMRLLFFKEKKENPLSPLIGQNTEIISEGRIRKLYAKNSESELLGKNEISRIKIGQKLITK